MRQYYVYILASRSRTLYVGVTNDLRRRLWEHKQGVRQGFTRDYRVTMLVYFESASDVRAAIAREKQLKRWPRWRKERLIEVGNKDWHDLSVDWFRDHLPGRAIGEGR
jgi:putative endonuclease